MELELPNGSRKTMKAREAFKNALENGAKKTGTLYNFIGTCELRLGNPESALNYYNLGLASEDISKGTEAGNGI